MSKIDIGIAEADREAVAPEREDGGQPPLSGLSQARCVVAYRGGAPHAVARRTSGSVALQRKVGVPARQAHRDVGNQRVEEALTVQRVDAGTDGEVQTRQHRDEQRGVHDSLGDRDVDPEPRSGTGRFADSAGGFR